MVAELLDLVRSDGARRREDQERFIELRVHVERLAIENAHLHSKLMEQAKWAAAVEALSTSKKTQRTFMVQPKDGSPPRFIKAFHVREAGPGNFLFDKSASGDDLERIEDVAEVTDTTSFESVGATKKSPTSTNSK